MPQFFNYMHLQLKEIVVKRTIQLMRIPYATYIWTAVVALHRRMHVACFENIVPHSCTCLLKRVFIP